MCLGSLADGIQSSLCPEERSLGLPSRKLAIGQHHRGVGDRLSARGGGPVFGKTARRLERESSLLESTLGVFCVLQRFEVDQTALKVSRALTKPRIDRGIGRAFVAEGSFGDDNSHAEGQKADENRALGSATDT